MNMALMNTMQMMKNNFKKRKVPLFFTSYQLRNNFFKKGCKNIYFATTFAFFTDGLSKFDELYKNKIVKKVY